RCGPPQVTLCHKLLVGLVRWPACRIGGLRASLNQPDSPVRISARRRSCGCGPGMAGSCVRNGFQRGVALGHPSGKYAAENWGNPRTISGGNAFTDYRWKMGFHPERILFSFGCCRSAALEEEHCAFKIAFGKFSGIVFYSD